MQPFDPTLLPTFLAVLRHRGIGAAARATHLSQPAVTARVRRLERSLGAALVARSAEGVTPTPAGERLAAYAREVQRLLDEASVAVPESRGSLGKLAIAASTTIAAHVLPKALARFRARYPSVPLEVTIGNTSEVIEALRTRAAPLGLVEGHARAAGVRLEPWLDDELLPVAGGDSPWRPRDAGELREVPILWREPGSGTRAVVARALGRAGIRKRPREFDLELGSSDAIAGAAAAGLGVAFLSRWALGAHLASGRLRTLPALGLTIRRTFRWALPGSESSGAAGAFLALSRAEPPVPD